MFDPPSRVPMDLIGVITRLCRDIDAGPDISDPVAITDFARHAEANLAPRIIPDRRYSIAETLQFGVTKSAFYNATAQGNGGTISVKAAKSTEFAGNISATGGPRGGNGGQAEISGARVFYTGSVDLSAHAGSTGTLLFDPDEITIVSGNAATPPGISGGLWGFTQDSGAQTISVGAIESLLAGANLELQATTNLTVATPGTGAFASIASNTTNTLTLTAPTITINAPISLPNGTLTFNWPDSLTGTYGSAQSLTSSASATLTANAIQVAADYRTLTLSGPAVTPSLRFTAPTVEMAVSIANSANVIQAVSFDPANTSGNGAQSVDIETSSALTVSGNLLILGSSPSVLLAAGDLTFAPGMSLQGGGFLSLVSTGDTPSSVARSIRTTPFSPTSAR